MYNIYVRKQFINYFIFTTHFANLTSRSYNRLKILKNNKKSN